eukprot:TRINITY_DN58725_c0_g1_i1.p1 TRINITY_DN58725_c0_g1~~TRINITY_DN58725_c0_g1_i1.p1  ORF type:complete len:362 (+),score=45.79 TRINITY_DN58725_c0_g1_i1:61-1086(+)
MGWGRYLPLGVVALVVAGFTYSRFAVVSQAPQPTLAPTDVAQPQQIYYPPRLNGVALAAVLRPYAKSSHLAPNRWRFPLQIPSVDRTACPKLAYFGGPANWPMCVIPEIWERDCVVYSFRVGGDDKFEKDVAMSTMCRVLSFDPMTHPEDHRISKVPKPGSYELFPWGLGSKTAEEWVKNDWTRFVATKIQYFNFADLVRRFNHSTSHIACVRLDIENMEFGALPSILQHPGVSQLLVELHPVKPEHWTRAIQHIAAAGFVLFGKEPGRIQRVQHRVKAWQERYYIRNVTLSQLDQPSLSAGAFVASAVSSPTEAASNIAAGNSAAEGEATTETGYVTAAA